MKFQILISQIMLGILICSSNINAQYDNGTVIYSKTGSTNITSVLKNYIVVDFNGDNYADVIMVKSNDTHQLIWYKGDGNGNFSPQSNLLSVDEIYKENEIFYEDMNGDGINDIVFQNSDTGFTVLFNDGQGNISAQLSNEVTIDNPFETDLKELADVDGDGDMDGIFWKKNYNYYFPVYQGYCLIGHNNGNGYFSNYTYLDNDQSEMFLLLETGDVDNDGDLDVICSGQMTSTSIITGLNVDPFVRLYENIGSNNFEKKEIALPSIGNEIIFFSNIKIRDINSDGNKELLVEYALTNLCGSHGEICGNSHKFQILDYDTQNEQFAVLKTYNFWLHGYLENESLYGSPYLYNNAFNIQLSHQTTDNNLDILSVNVPLGRLQWFLGDGNGNFNNTQVVNFNNQYGSTRPALRVADIDNDTDLDIFVLLNDDTSSTLTVFENLTLTPSCSPVLDLANASLTDGIYQAGITLISSSEVAAGNNNIVLKAGNNIKLESGFKVPANSSLKVRISSCN